MTDLKESNKPESENPIPLSDLEAVMLWHLRDSDRYVNYLEEHTKKSLPITDKSPIVVIPVHREEMIIIYPQTEYQLVCVFNDVDPVKLEEAEKSIYERGIIPISVLFKPEDGLSNKIGSIGMARAIGINSVIESLKNKGYDLNKYRIYWQDADTRISTEDISEIERLFDKNNKVLLAYTQTRVLFYTDYDLDFHPTQLLAQSLSNISDVSKFINKGVLPKYIGGPRIVTRSNFYTTRININIDNVTKNLTLLQLLSLNHYDEDFVTSEAAKSIFDSHSVVLVPQVTMVRQRHNQRGDSIIVGDAQMNRTWARAVLSEYTEDISELLEYLTPNILSVSLPLDKSKLLNIFQNLLEQNTYFSTAYEKEMNYHLKYIERYKV